MLAKILHNKQKKTFLLLNKIDSIYTKVFITEFYQLGFKNIFYVSSINKINIQQLFNKNIVANVNNIKVDRQSNEFLNLNSPELINKTDTVTSLKQKKVNVTIIGKPNVGKSTLANKLINSNKIITDKKSGTTQNSITIPVHYNNNTYLLTDTAGIRRKKKIIPNSSEKLFTLESIYHLKKSDIAIILLNIKEYNCKQNIRLINLAIKYKCSIIIAINKCDTIPKKEIKQIKQFLIQKYKTSIFNNFKLYFISALLGIGIKNLLLSIQNLSKKSCYDFKSSFLTKILHLFIKKHQPHMVNKNRIKLKFAHPEKNNPFKIIIHGNQTNLLSTNYKKYLTKNFKKQLNMMNNPLTLIFKNNKNPYVK